MRTLKTGNELFDIFWKDYPARNNKKVTKKASLTWFKKHDPPEETVYDMIQWLKKDKENRDLLTYQKQFCPPPQDAIRFLNAEAWVYDEIGKVCTKTSRREAHRGKAVYANTVKDYISGFRNIIHGLTIQELLHHKQFRHACGAYPEVKTWALKERPDLEGARPDKILPQILPQSPPQITPKTPPTVLESAHFQNKPTYNPTLSPTSDADLPPPKPEINPIVEQFIKDYDLFGK